MAGTLGGVGDPWNVNIHYDALLDRSVPVAAASVLDVGCGDGFLAARLARRVPHVVAVDVDEPVLARARARFSDAAVAWRHGDIRTDSLPPRAYDAVVSNAMLHHLSDTDRALRRLGGLVRPGGVLAIVTFVRAEWRELPWAVATLAARRAAIGVRGKWEHTAPQSWPPPDTFRQLRHHVRAALPGACLSRLLLGRCLVLWQAPRQ